MRFLAQSGYDLRSVVETMLRSNLFFSPQAYRTQIKSPVDFAVGIVHGLEGRVGAEPLAEALEGLGQRLFSPPSVKGWLGGTTWINSTTLLLRDNLALALTSTQDSRFNNRRTDPAALARKYGRKTDEEIVDFFAKLFLQNDLPADARASLLDYLATARRQSYPDYWSAGGSAEPPRSRGLPCVADASGFSIELARADERGPQFSRRNLMSTRREFVKATLSGAGIVAWGQTVPLFLSRTALAAGDHHKPGTKDTLLVVVQLTGGNDGLNTVVPYADDGYGQAPQGSASRPEISRRSTPNSACIRRWADWPACSKIMPWRSCKGSAIRIRTNRISARWTSGRRRASPKI